MSSSDEPLSSASSVQITLPAAESSDPDALLCVFEGAWQSGNQMPIESLLTRLPMDDPASESARRHLLVEMVKIDLEYRWRSAEAKVSDGLPARPLLEDYANRYPALGPPDRLPLELIGAEYRVRRLWGDRPERATYLVRFPTHAELSSLLDRMDAELAEHAVHTTMLTASMKGRAPIAVGAVPDGYEILGELGRGGMGVVYQARQVRLNRLVAIKMIRAGEETGSAALARFRTEAEAAARVQHPHVVQVYQVGEKDGQPFCVMEYVNGGSLAQRLAGAPLEARVAARLLETLARAVQAIHDQGILHRDLKPANVLLQVLPSDQTATLTSALLQSPGCVPKISDFGLAKLAESAGLTQTGAVLGTPSYMAPEQADSRSDALGVATDVYGLGAILYEMLTGRPPFRGVHVLDTLEQVRLREPLPPRQLQPAVPRDLEIICLKCLQKEPAKRYARAAELADDLERFRQNQPILARAASRWERGLKWARRRPTLATLLAASLLGLLAALLVGLAYTLQLRAAHAETESQRKQAGRSYRKALQAVEQMLVRMGAKQLEAVPGTEKTQIDALTDAIRLYQDLLDDQDQPDPELYARMSFALSYLGNRQMGLGRPDEAERNCRRSLELLDRLPAALRETTSCHHQAAFARYILGNIRAEKNDRADAEKQYLEAHAILISQGNDLAARKLLVDCYAALGKYATHPARAKDYFERAVDLCEFLHKDDPNNWHYRNDLAQALYNLGHYHLFSGNAAAAETLLNRCLVLLEPLAARGSVANDPILDRVRAANILFHCYSALGILFSNRGAADKSETFHLKAIARGEELARLYPHPPERMELSQSYVTMGGMYHAKKQRKKAEEMYRKGIAIQEALAQELPSIPIYRIRLAESYGNLSLVLNSITEASTILQKGRDVLEPLMRDHPEDTTYANDYGNLCLNQALVLFHHGDSRKALPWHDRAIEVLTAAHRRNPHNGDCTYRCAMALGARSVTWTALQEYKKALADFDQLIELVGPSQADRYRFQRAMLLTQLGEHRRAAEDIGKVLHRVGGTLEERFLCVCVLSHLLEAAENDAQLKKEERTRAADRYAATALAALTQLRKDGYFRTLQMWLQLVTEKDLAALRAREDYKRWLKKQIGW